MSIQERFSQTDRALEEVPTWPNVSKEICKLNSLGIELMTLFTKLEKTLTTGTLLKVSTLGADGSEAFKSKLKFQIQHEVFR